MKKANLFFLIVLLFLGCIDLGNPFQGPDWQRCPPSSGNIVGYECGHGINTEGLKLALPANFHDSLRNNTAYQDSICNSQSNLKFISWVCE